MLITASQPQQSRHCHRFNLSSLDRVKAWHTIIEAERLAFADRDRFIGDPSYVAVPVTGLLNPEFAKVRRQSIGERAPGKDFRALAGDPFPFQKGASVNLPAFPPPPITNQPQDNSTTHLTVIDRFGNIVSYTSTLEQIGGSGIVVPGYGLISLGHVLEPVPEIGAATGISIAPNGSIAAAAEPVRKGGGSAVTVKR